VGARRVRGRLTTVTRVRALGLVLALAAPSHSETLAPIVEFLHVGASEGRSLGGHAALRVGDRIFPFQHRTPGILVLDRTDPDAFRWSYGTLQNRTIRSVTLAVSDGDARRLRTRLGTLYVTQREQLETKSALERDRALLTALLHQRRGAGPRFAVRGGAAFFPNGARLALASVGDGAREEPEPSAAAGTLSDAHAERLERLVALDVLARGRHVRPERLRVIENTAPLADLERSALRSFRRHLERAVTRLPHSNRPDWGLALLVTLARLDATNASLARGRLVVVDAPAAAGDRIPTVTAHDRAYATEVWRGATRALADVRASSLSKGVLDERSWSRLEQAGLRVLASHPARAGAILDLPYDASPTEVALLDGLPAPRIDQDAAREALSRTEAALEAWNLTIRETYGYDLLHANCVTALIDVLEDTHAAGIISRRFLGSTGFIPRVAFDRIAASPNASPARIEPSYRRRRLAEMETREARFRVRLREDNVLTTTLRRAPTEQPAFLFFTDATVLARPLYGVANLGVASLQTLGGVLGAPFDGARNLRLGLRGVVASVPELAFFSVRTGRFRYDQDGTRAPRESQASSDGEAEVDDVAVLHDVLLAFEP